MIRYLWYNKIFNFAVTSSLEREIQFLQITTIGDAQIKLNLRLSTHKLSSSSRKGRKFPVINPANT